MQIESMAEEKRLVIAGKFNGVGIWDEGLWLFDDIFANIRSIATEIGIGKKVRVTFEEVDD